MVAKKILAISPYPTKGNTYNHPHSAVASYAKNTLISFLNHSPNTEISVLADKFRNSQSSYQEDHITVIRVWKRNQPLIFFTLIKEINKYKYFKKILFEFEWAMFGYKKWLMLFVPFFIFILNLRGKKVFFVSHGLLLDVNTVAQQLNLKPQSIITKFLSWGLKLWYQSICILSHRIIVFEEYLRQQLLTVSSHPDKIITIPHGVDTSINQITPKQARGKLHITDNKFIIMVFGFLIWYKGSDWIVDAMHKYFKNHHDSQIELWMVGGPSRNYQSDPTYQKFINKIKQQAADSNNKIKITGFIDEQDIGLYFQACDLVILPYRAMLSSSGPLSLAFSYQKPVMLSEKLKGYLQTEDIQNSLKKHNIHPKHLYFSLNKTEFISTIKKQYQDKKLLSSLNAFSSEMKQNRIWTKIGKQYDNILSS